MTSLEREQLIRGTAQAARGASRIVAKASAQQRTQAGQRVGYCLGAPELIRGVRTGQVPFSVSALAQRAPDWSRRDWSWAETDTLRTLAASEDPAASPPRAVARPVSAGRRALPDADSAAASPSSLAAELKRALKKVAAA